MKNIGKISIILVILLALAFVPFMLFTPEPPPARAAAYDYYATSAVTAGDVVVFDSGTSYAVKTTTTEASELVAGVAFETVAINNNCGIRISGGRVAVNVTGDAVSRGDWLITSTTAGSAKGVQVFQDGVFARAITNEGTPAADQVYATLMVSFQKAFDATEMDYGEVSGGTRYIYVDTSAGSDSNLGTSSSKVATIAKAWDVIPPLVLEPTIIDVDADTYTETLVFSGKTIAAANASITIRGTLSNSDTGTAEAGGTSTIQDTDKAWGVNAHQYDLVRLTGGTGDGQERWIYSNTADTLTIAGRWETTPDATTTYSIDTMGTTISPGAGNTAFTLTNQAGVTIKYFLFSAGKYGVYAQSASVANTVQACDFDSQTTGGLWIGEGSTVLLQSNQVDSDARGITLDTSAGNLYDNWVFDCGSVAGVHLVAANFQFKRNYIAANLNKGVLLQRNAVASFWTSGNVNYIKNHGVAGDYGIYTELGSMGLNATSQSFVNNDTDEDADANTFGYNS